MGHKKDKQITPFRLEGRFLGYLLEDGYKLKYLRLGTATGEVCIKLSKAARLSLGRVLQPGEWVQVGGDRVMKSGKVKWKADGIQAIAPCAGDPPIQPLPPSPHPAATILVCQKSDCMKRGGRAVCEALAKELGDRGLGDRVTVRATGCMKQCKTAANLVVMPDKKNYRGITAAEIPALLDRHFPSVVV